jgi:two-component system chemotaxis response regulator CheB
MPPRKIVVIGSSTGGPPTLKRLCARLRQQKVAVIIIQHMPAHLNEPLTQSLGKVTDMEVRLAKDGDELADGVIMVAPTGRHLELVDNRTISLRSGLPVNHALPSIDVAMKSAQTAFMGEMVGVVLTGLGRDGAEGLRHMKRIGATTIVQNKETAAIFGMPEAAQHTGAVDLCLAPEEIGDEIATMRIPVRDEFDVVVVRHAARSEARQLGFGVLEQTSIVTAVSELARNVLVHGDKGVVEMRALRAGEAGKVGLQFVVRDRGPGIVNVDEAMQDGFSTVGSLGVGLGGTRRLMDEFRLQSAVSEGTTVFIRKWL